MTDSAILLSRTQAHCEPGPRYVRAIHSAAADLRRWFDKGFSEDHPCVSVDKERLAACLNTYSFPQL
jgi:hypothetical protein